VIGTPYESKNHGTFSTADQSEYGITANGPAFAKPTARQGNELTRIKSKKNEPRMNADLRG
jgi:hypothetical protein